MKRSFLVLALALAAAWPAAQAALAGPEAPDVPAKIAVPAGNKLFLIGHAEGVQIHSCDAVPGGYRWNFVAPRATLYDDNGKILTTHFAGPSWQAKDGSIAVGTVVDRAPVEGAIPWLLLSTTSAPGSDGDRLAGTTFIQRIATTGGLAPAAASCNAETAGDIAEVAYTADYTFWKSSG
jgi:hypothetical protein